VRDGRLGALFGQVARGGSVAFEAVYCRTAGQVLGVGVSRAAWCRQVLGRAAAAMLSACAPGQAGFGARGGLPGQRGGTGAAGR
jgi:hypothetical protein